MYKSLYSAVIVLFLIRTGFPTFPSNPDTNTWSTNKIVRTTVQAGNKVYIGGDFTYVGPYTGPSALLDSTSGYPVRTFPKVYGVIYAATPDGNNGWYIGGNFSLAWGSGNVNLLHIFNDHTIDRSWNPQPDSSVRALLLNGSVLFVGGDFNYISGVSQKYLACIDLTTGVLKRGWSPLLNGPVSCFAVKNNRIYAGGAFDTANGQHRNHLACFEVTTGRVTSWTPNPLIDLYPVTAKAIIGYSTQSKICAMAISESEVYVGGMFDTIGGQLRRNIASIDTANGTAKTFNVTIDGQVSTMHIQGSRLYVGGSFTRIDNTTRKHIASFDLTSNKLTSWNPEASFDVLSICGWGRGEDICGGPFPSHWRKGA